MLAPVAARQRQRNSGRVPVQNNSLLTKGVESGMIKHYNLMHALLESDKP